MVALLLAGPARGQTIIYVDTDATGANDGTSWADAFVYLQDALAIAQDGDEVWVAEGVYRPDQGNGFSDGDRSAYFEIPVGVNLRGGFQASEESVDQRLGTLPFTVLTGDLLGNDADVVVGDDPSRQDNAVFVVLARSAGTVTLDGLVIEGAVADGNVIRPVSIWGAGLYAFDVDLVMDRVTIRQNATYGAYLRAGSMRATGLLVESNTGPSQGGGLVCLSSELLDIRRSVFRNNHADVEGGGLWASGCRTRLIDVVIESNEGQGLALAHAPFIIIGAHVRGNEAPIGAGLYVGAFARGLLANIVFSGNRAVQTAGAVLVSDNASLAATNLTLANNEAGFAGASLEIRSAEVAINNSIILTDPFQSGHIFLPRDDAIVRFSHCIVTGGIPAGSIDLGGNMDVDPLFACPLGADGIAGTSDDELWVAAKSPAVDAGENGVLPPDSLDLDLDGDRSESLPVDLIGAPRRWNSMEGSAGGDVDLGAYERTGSHISGSLPPHATHETHGTLEVYPTPAGETVRYRLTEVSAPVRHIRIIDLLGRVVTEMYAISDTSIDTMGVVDLRNLSTGIYFMIIDLGRINYSAMIIHQ